MNLIDAFGIVLAEATAALPAEPTPGEMEELRADYSRIALRLEAYKKTLDELMLDTVRRNRNAVIGGKTWYVGNARNYKCKDVKAVVAAIAEIEGVNGVMDCISSDGLKPATVRTHFEEAGIPDAFDKLFVVSTRETVIGKDVETSDLKPKE